MSKDCFESCPRIKEILDTIKTDNTLAGAFRMHPDIFKGDNSGAQRLLQACKNTYDCQGPVSQTVLQETGIFHVRLEPVQQITCGLENKLTKSKI